MKTITPELLKKFEAGYAKRPDLKILANALTDTTITEAAFVPLNAAKLRMDFSITTPATGVTNQKQSGRCWIFAAMNLARERVIKKCNLEEFSLSGTYLAFFDKLEKANNFFEAILAYSDEPIDSRANSAIIKNSLSRSPSICLSGIRSRKKSDQNLEGAAL